MQERNPLELRNPYFPSMDVDFGHISGPSESFSRGGPTLHEYFQVLARRWRVLAAAMIFALTAATLYVFCTTTEYAADSTILIERETPQVLDMKQLLSEEADESGQDNFYETQHKILESRSLAAEVIHNLHLDHDPRLSVGPLNKVRSVVKRPARDEDASASSRDSSTPVPHFSAIEASIEPQVIDAYLDDLDIHPEPGTRLVTVSFTNPDPELTARVVNAHVQAYIARGTELRAQASHSAQKFLQDKLVELKKRVESSEAALNTYRSERGIVTDASEDKTKVEMERLVELNKALTDAETERITLEAQVHLLMAQDYNLLPAVVEEPVIQGLKQEEARVEADYASLASEYKADYPPLADLAAKRDELQSRLQREIRRIANGIKWKYQASLSREQKLRDEIENEKKRALTLNDSSVQDAILARDVDTNRELYKSVLARMNELGMAAGISASNVSVVDYAQPPTRPSGPNLPLSFGLSGLFGLLLGVAGVFVVDRLDDSFKSPQEVEYTFGLPALGVVPDFRAVCRDRRHSRYLVAASDDTRLPAAIEDAGAGTSADSLHAASEAYRAIRLGIQLSCAETPPKVLLVTSGSVREGKTVTAINTAAVFAQMGEDVLLIDADLRRSRCHQVLNVPGRAGLTEILTGNVDPRELVRPTPIAGLSCIVGGSSPPNPAALLASKRMAEVLGKLRETYSCIVIDSAPLMAVTDSLFLTSLVDGVLLVASPETTKKDFRFLCTRLTQVRAKVLGVILNRFSPDGQNFRHYYHYYSSADTANAA